jgi:hypothetical protein
MGHSVDLAAPRSVKLLWLAVAILALVASCSRSTTDFCSKTEPICPDDYSCVDDRCQFGVDAGTDGGI